MTSVSAAEALGLHHESAVVIGKRGKRHWGFIVASLPHMGLRGRDERGADMLETIAIILIVLWLLGLVTGYTLGNFIYILLVVGIILFLVRLFSRA
ncbi:MAG: lmo0937 family membrane protein [Trueperaceae bacterium]